MKHILIDRGDGTGTLVRSKVESAGEDPLSENEILINELYSKICRTHPAYLVDSNDEQIVVLADNLADACDKLDANGHKGYVFMRSASLDVLK